MSLVPTIDRERRMSPKEAELLIEGRAAAQSGRGRALRKAAGLSLAELAELVGVSTPTVYYWETGDRRPTGERAIEYALVLRLIDAKVEAEAQRGGHEGA